MLFLFLLFVSVALIVGGMIWGIYVLARNEEEHERRAAAGREYLRATGWKGYPLEPRKGERGESHAEL